MGSYKVFQHGIERSYKFLEIFLLLKNRRQRRSRSDWAEKFNGIMHESKSRPIERIDGSGGMIILTKGSQLFGGKIDDLVVKDILRAAIVFGVSSLDRYLHDLITEKCISAIKGAVGTVPKELLKLSIPVVAINKIIERARKPGSRPEENLLKIEIRDALHREHTFQSAESIKKAMSMVGVQNLYANVCSTMHMNDQDVSDRLTKIVRKRHSIAHEMDVERKIRVRKITLKKIRYAEIKRDIDWLKAFGAAINVNI